ncbi:MAG: NADPH-dependent 7-cyano-7-deazaguanine reductase QueF [Gammaproteobacteria bacterium HGW-Gammaproteobacteria-4]|jgi:7-cyano-7-deazaguanine reductase|nr:MAG: NADPH-dependent 7-cyano-7-deazaguanine reductase QueF [Gammaproteobacteria bacterium HGW-Gammaproteobacteria-4]
MNPLTDSSLGKPVGYTDQHDPSLLFPVARAGNRAALGLGDVLPFHGTDIWNAYELGWLDARGKPRVVLAEFRIPADSPHLVESKSFKLYLNSFAQTRLDHSEALRNLLVADLSQAAGAAVKVVLTPVTSTSVCVETLSGECIDDLPIGIDHYGPPRPEFLRHDAEAVVEESLVSHLLRSNCPVTGQPDWGSVQIAYRGPRIDRAGLLRYLISFRQHSEFHEHCVERIFVDVLARCAPTQLSVYARYTRRGGLDINPWRSNRRGIDPGNPRLCRQ